MAGGCQQYPAGGLPRGPVASWAAAGAWQALKKKREGSGMNKSLCLRKQAAQSERRLLRRKARQGREEREDDDHRSAERSQQPVRTCIPKGLRREDVHVVAVTDLTGSVQFCMLGYPYLHSKCPSSAPQVASGSNFLADVANARCGGSVSTCESSILSVYCAGFTHELAMGDACRLRSTSTGAALVMCGDPCGEARS